MERRGCEARVDALVERLRVADHKFAAAILGIVALLKNKPPSDDLLRVARRRWVNDIPSFGCVSTGPTPEFRRGVLTITEDRAVLGAEGARWWDRADPPVIAVVRLRLTYGPRGLAVPVDLLRRASLGDVAAWFAANPDGSDQEALKRLVITVND